MWYVQKAFILPGFNLIKAHIIDDDCNEFIGTIKGSFIMRGYFGYSELNVIDKEPYSCIEWSKLMDAVEYMVEVKKV